MARTVKRADEPAMSAARLPAMTAKRGLTSRGASRMGERERSTGIDPDDAAGRWLREHDPAPPIEPSKSSRQSVELHRFRKRQGAS